MDKSTKNDFQDTNRQTVIALNTQLSSKRRRTDWANSCTEMFCKTDCFPSSASTLQMTADQASTDDCGNIEDEEPYGTAVTVNLIANLSASHARDASMSSPEGAPLTDELPLDAEFVKLCQHLQNNAGGELAKTNTSPDSCTNTSNHSDCKLWRESLEDSPPVGCNLSIGNGLEERHVVSGDRELQVLNCSWKTWHPAENDQEEEITPSKEEGSAENSFVSYIYYSDKNFEDSNIEDSNNLADAVKIKTKKGEKDNDNDKGLSGNIILCAAQCAEGSIVPYDVASVGKLATENGGIEDDVLCRVKGERAAGEMIAKAGRKDTDHPAETLLPAGISQEHAGGDNDAGRLSVIDPAICGETDSESGGTRCYSQSRTDANLVPSLEVRQMETPLTLGSDIMPSISKHRGEIHECKDEKGSPCPPYTAPLVRPNSADRKQNQTGKGFGACCSAEQHLAEDKGTLVNMPKVQTQSGCFPVISNETLGDDTQVQLACDYKESQVNVMEKLSSNIPTCQHAELLNPKDQVQGLGRYDEYGNKLAYTHEKYNTVWVSDHMYCAVCPLIEEAIEDNSSSRLEAEVNSQKSVPQEVLQSPNTGSGEALDVSVNEMSKGTSESQSVSQPEGGCQSICFSNCCLTEETVPADYLTSADAVVPGELTPSLNTRVDPMAPNGTDRSSLLSAELDSLERIQFSLNDDCSRGDSACTVLSTDSVEDDGMTNKQEVLPQKEEQKIKQREEMQHQNTSPAHSPEKSHSNPSEDQDLTQPGAPARRLAGRPTVCSSPLSCFSLLDVQDDLDTEASDLNQLPTTEMKKQFDMVLTELSLYFEISMNEFTNDKCKEITEASKGKTSDCSDAKLSSPGLKPQRDELLGK